MKIIFLDFDGPLSNVRVTLGYGCDQAMDPVTIRSLNHICEASGAKIVCTSVRAVLKPGAFEENMRYFKEAGLDLSHIHSDWSCNTSNGGNRYEQINEWLKKHPGVTHYAVVDDERVRDRQGNNHPKLVKTSMRDGMAFSQFERIAQLLDFELLNAFREARGPVSGWRMGQMILPFERYDARHNVQYAVARISSVEESLGTWCKTDKSISFAALHDSRILVPVGRSYPDPVDAFSIAVSDLRQGKERELYVRQGARIIKTYMPE